jgi:hypothetical protein
MTRSRNHLRGYPGVSIHREWPITQVGKPDLRGPFQSVAVSDQRCTTRARALALHRIRDTRRNAASIKRPAVSRHLRSTAKEPKNVGARSSARDRCAAGASTISTMTSEPNRTYRA